MQVLYQKLNIPDRTRIKIFLCSLLFKTSSWLKHQFKHTLYVIYHYIFVNCISAFRHLLKLAVCVLTSLHLILLLSFSPAWGSSQGPSPAVLCQISFQKIPNFPKHIDRPFNLTKCQSRNQYFYSFSFYFHYSTSSDNDVRNREKETDPNDLNESMVCVMSAFERRSSFLSI